MTIKNADMPAMPQPMVKCDDGDVYTTFDNYGGKQAGLTKREMFAKDSNVFEQYESVDNYPDMAEILGEKYEKSMTETKRLELEFRFMAKLKVMAADALLKELEK